MHSIRTYQGHAPTVGERVYVDPQACVIGRVTLGTDASVWPMAVLRGDVHDIVIGDRSNVQDGSVLHVTHAGPFSPEGGALWVGNDVTIGHNVTLHACTVGHRCLIGMGAVVLDGAFLEDDVMVAAGTVVPPRKRLRARTLWVGNPAREARVLSARDLEQLAYSAAHYVRVKDAYRQAPPDEG